MPAAFLQQCDHSLGIATRNGSLGKPMVEHICQNWQKHVRHRQIHFVEQAIQFRRFVEAYLPQHIADFTLCNQPLVDTRFRLLKAGKVG